MPRRRSGAPRVVASPDLALAPRGSVRRRSQRKRPSRRLTQALLCRVGIERLEVCTFSEPLEKGMTECLSRAWPSEDLHRTSGNLEHILVI